jgi:uncharacterized damage-inducible protein DinB
MSKIEMVRELFLHMEWADSRVWAPILASPGAQADSILRDRLFHIHVVHWAFLHVWRQRTLPELPNPSTFPDIAAIAAWGRKAHEEISAYIGEVDEAALDQHVTLFWADQFETRFGSPPAPITLGETMLQVITHSSHHRGQVNTRLRELGSEPPFVDLIVWVCLGKPPADWANVPRTSTAAFAFR